MSQGAELARHEGRALERSTIERRRAIVARYRWIESHMSAAEIADVLRKDTPPIVVSIRTIERDFNTIRADVRRYVDASSKGLRCNAFRSRVSLDRDKSP